MNSILPSASTLAVGARPAHPNVSVVMVVYRTGEALAQSIKHVLAEPLVDEFIIIDNGSSPQDEDMLRSLALTEPRVVLKQGHGNIGFARAANMGASTGGGEYIVFLNPDANLQPGCVAALVTAFKGQPTPTIVGARVLNVDGSEQRGGRRGEVTPISTVLSFGQLTRRYPKLAGFEIHRENEPVPRCSEPSTFRTRAPTMVGVGWPLKAVTRAATQPGCRLASGLRKTMYSPPPVLAPMLAARAKPMLPWPCLSTTRGSVRASERSMSSSCGEEPLSMMMNSSTRGSASTCLTLSASASPVR